MSKSVHDFSCKRISGEDQALSEYQGKVLLIINTASKCGLTPQYEGLEKLYEDYRDKGVEVLGFPCNQFASQEPGSESDIATFCETNYGVTFPMFAKVKVNGGGADPLFKHLRKETAGLLGVDLVKWNFTKFLVDGDGNVVRRYEPTVTPNRITPGIDALLKN